MNYPSTHGVLLINLGTPEQATLPAVRRYLREFLSDRRVINLPALLRYLLLYGIILPFRARRTTHAYQAIWTHEGSPLRNHSQQLCQKLQMALGSQYKVVLGMRYGQPSINAALNELRDCSLIQVLPLYPQYSSAATGSAIENVLVALAPQTVFPSLQLRRDFHQHPSYIKAQAALIKPYLSTHDHLLLSYHGLPENQLHQSGCQTICATTCPSTATSSITQSCYRAQCLQTSTLLAETLGLTDTQYNSAFQSRLGKTPWIKPYTDELLPQLAARGIKRLAVACPSFVADCLETLEEIGLRAKQQWREIGGEELTLIPCLNATDAWVNALVDIIVGETM